MFEVNKVIAYMKMQYTHLTEETKFKQNKGCSSPQVVHTMVQKYIHLMVHQIIKRLENEV